MSSNGKAHTKDAGDPHNAVSRLISLLYAHHKDNKAVTFRIQYIVAFIRLQSVLLRLFRGSLWAIAKATEHGITFASAVAFRMDGSTPR